MEVSPLTCSPEELFTFISARDPRTLRQVLDNPALNEDHLISLLRNPSIPTDVIQEITERSEWISRYKIQFAVAGCPKTPYAVAMRLLPLLFWNDMVKVASNHRLKPQLRRAAERYLRDKISDLSIGEKLTLARTGPRAVALLLRDDTEPSVISALMRNPALTEDDVLAIAGSDQTPSEVLFAIGTDYKWSPRYAVRLVLVRNPATPLPLALSFVSRLTQQDLRMLNQIPDINELLRRTIARILDGRY
jgi:hypothetical protein